MNAGVNYNMFYEILLNLRENFHSYGRIDDSNAKLDEIVKLISLSYSLATKKVKFSLAYVREQAKIQYGDENAIAESLIFLFEKESQTKMFFNNDGTNIFGTNNSLNLQPSENDFAEKLVAEIGKIDFISLLSDQQYSNFDIINECFGHFVRDNFRNNKEDAQYMTPFEITLPMLNLIFHDMERDAYLTSKSFKSFKVMDPTCGVGTLLIESSNRFTQYIQTQAISDSQKKKIIKDFRTSGVIGQDKVDRMVRLSKINTLLMGGNISNIFSGNSIIGESAINAFYGQIDFIFTNPPFGAEYSLSNLDLTGFPLVSQLSINTQTVTSEILMLDKCLSLLKTGGYLAIVLPDSIFSSKGVNAQIRKFLLANYNIRAVVELPSVTFAQAGTRTNTSILYLKKEAPNKNQTIIMSVCKDIGYIVKERLGVPVKINVGQNQMIDIAANYITKETYSSTIISTTPSVTNISENELVDEILNPSFYSADRLSTINSLENLNNSDYKLMKLSEIADFVTLKRKSYHASSEIKHISVLHINADCTINFQEVRKFSPISKGRECIGNDLLFSKINPRIPRMAVIPPITDSLVCSTEFEILKPKQENMGVYTLCLLLKSNYVSKQIENLTSGTSSSHSRIKREQLTDILIPYPITSNSIKFYNEIEQKLAHAFEMKYAADNILKEQFDLLECF